MKQMLKATDDQIHKYFHFADSTEFLIFLVWGLFASAFLTLLFT
jgi:hypothetical protein